MDVKLDDRARRDWIRLIRTKGLGVLTFQRLLNRYGPNASDIIKALPNLKGAVSKLILASEDSVQNEIEQAEKFGARYIAQCEPDYPEFLRTIADPPPIICVYGDTQALLKPSIAIIGARNASAAGRRLSREISLGLAEQGFNVVSGLARGIDADAHKGALNATARLTTTAVMAGGVNKIYPPEHAELHTEIAQSGLILSEAPFGYVAKAQDFPRRNRIVSGLSLGVVVIEASQRSGSLITSRLALEQGREVMAAPGSPLDERTSGSNGLIKQGAWLIENADDVVSALEGMAFPRQSSRVRPKSGQMINQNTDLTHEQIERLKEALSPTPCSLDDLIAATGLHASQLRSALAELELDGSAILQPDGTASSAPAS